MKMHLKKIEYSTQLKTFSVETARNGLKKLKTFSLETARNGLKPEPVLSSIGRCITLQDLEDTNAAAVMLRLAVPDYFITI